jgi:hypothetical protein
LRSPTKRARHCIARLVKALHRKALHRETRLCDPQQDATAFHRSPLLLPLCDPAFGLCVLQLRAMGNGVGVSGWGCCRENREEALEGLGFRYERLTVLSQKRAEVSCWRSLRASLNATKASARASSRLRCARSVFSSGAVARSRSSSLADSASTGAESACSSSHRSSPGGRWVGVREGGMDGEMRGWGIGGLGGLASGEEKTQDGGQSGGCRVCEKWTKCWNVDVLGGLGDGQDVGHVPPPHRLLCTEHSV